MPTVAQKARLRFQDAGLVGASPEKVFAAATELVSGHGGNLEVDTVAGTLVSEGAWWYRGVWTFTPHDDGTVVRYEVYDIARTGRFAVNFILLQYRMKGALRNGLPSMVADLGRALGVPARHPL